MSQKGRDPLVCAIRDPVVIQLTQEPSTGYAIKRFGEIKDNKVHLSISVDCLCKLMAYCEQLGFAATPGPETMLAICPYLMFFQMCHNIAGDNVFLQLATDAGQ